MNRHTYKAEPGLYPVVLTSCEPAAGWEVAQRLDPRSSSYGTRLLGYCHQLGPKRWIAVTYSGSRMPCDSKREAVDFMRQVR